MIDEVEIPAVRRIVDRIIFQNLTNEVSSLLWYPLYVERD